MPRLSVRGKLLISIALLIVPFLGLVLSQLRDIYEHQEQSALSRQVVLARTVAVLADAIFDESIRLGLALANDPVLQSLDPSLCDPHLQRLAPYYPQNIVIELFTGNGDSVGSSVPYAPGEPRASASQDWFHQQAMASGQPVVSDVHLSRRFPGRPVVVVVVPMAEVAPVDGAVHVVIDLRQPPPQLAGVRLEPSDAVAIIDPWGRVAYYNRIPELSWEDRDVSQTPEFQEAVAGQTVQRDFFRPSGHVRTPRYGWVVSVGSPASVVFGPIEEISRRGIAVFVALALLGIIVALALSRHLLVPISQLMSLARALAQGQLDRRADVRTGDEIEDLGHAFNAMAEQLEATLRALERARDQAEADRVRLETIMDSAPHGIGFVEAATGRLILNSEATRLLGRHLAPEAGLAQLAGHILDTDGRPIPIHQLPASLALEGQTVRMEEMLIQRPDGTRLPVLMSAAPCRGRTEEVEGAVLVFQDISPLKELERLREEWVSIIAHDLRQPMTVIAGYIGLLRRLLPQHLGPAMEAKAIEHLEAATRNLNKMIEDLVDFSRIEARRLKLERRRGDLAQLVRAVVERSGEVTRGHPLRVEIRGTVPQVWMDPARIEQVLTNLLSNAAKYSYQDTEIRVEVEPQAEGVRVCVTNWGRGIAPEEMPYLFTRFHRTRIARAERVPGLGLGLYICRGLIEAHGGRIWAVSTPGKTTSFCFTLPITPEREEGERLA